MGLSIKIEKAISGRSRLPAAFRLPHLKQCPAHPAGSSA
jgi:hypothetical protein